MGLNLNYIQGKKFCNLYALSVCLYRSLEERSRESRKKKVDKCQVVLLTF